MIKRKVLQYTVFYTPEPEGGFTVTVPSLPGCVTYGKDLRIAKKMVEEAIRLYIESLQKRSEIIPTEENSFSSSVNLEFTSTHA